MRDWIKGTFAALLFLAACAGFATLFIAVSPDADAGPLQRFRDRGKAHPAPQADAPKASPKVMQAGPQVVEGLGDGELVKRIMLRRYREVVVDRAVKDGIPLPGGGVRKVTRAEAEKLVKRVTDDDVMDFAKVKGAPVGGLGDGTFLKWLWENKEAIIKFILSLLAIFADDMP